MDMKIEIQELNRKRYEQFKKYIEQNYKTEYERFNKWPISNDIEEKQPFAITIDNECSLDLDDALAISRDEYGMTLHVYISNTTPFLIHNPIYESIARERYKTLYFHRGPDSQKSYHILPRDCAENLLSLRENEVRNVIDHSFYVDYFGNVSYDISYKNIVTNKRFSFEEVDEMIKKKSTSEYRDYLQMLEKGIQIIYKKLGISKKYIISGESRAQKIVTGTSILINYMTASEAMKKQYLLLYQDYFNGKYSIKNSDNLYTRVSSPIRRYTDLKNNFLLHRFLNEKVSEQEYYQIEKELTALIPLLEDKKEQHKQFSKMIHLYSTR